MHAHQRPPTVGIAAAVAYVVVALAPYILLGAGPGVLEVYYAAGVAGPNLLSGFALLAVVLFAAGRQGRTEPDLIAGITLVLGLVLALVTFIWAISVPANVVFEAGAFGADSADASREWFWFEYHRWVTAGISVLIPLAAIWYARTLELF